MYLHSYSNFTEPIIEIAVVLLNHSWYEVDYLPALKGKTCVGIALYIWRAMVIVD
jgi:Fe-S oxidoreductase